MLLRSGVVPIVRLALNGRDTLTSRRTGRMGGRVNERVPYALRRTGRAETMGRTISGRANNESAIGILLSHSVDRVFLHHFLFSDS
jgi:hypothetical protein